VPETAPEAAQTREASAGEANTHATERDRAAEEVFARQDRHRKRRA